MKTIFSDFKKGIAKIKIENLDDLWYLSTILQKDDFIEGETYRKLKIGGNEEAESTKKRVFLKIKVEKVEFSEYSTTLRVSGIITDGPEDVPRGQYHTFNLEDGSIIKILKDEFLRYEQDKIIEASKNESYKILICIFDREEAIIAKLKKSGIEILTTLKGQVQKKAVDQQEKNFYQEIIKVVEEYNKKYEFNHVIFASPAFYKDYLLKEIKDDNFRKKVVSATCSGVSTSSINEVLKRDELRTVLMHDRAAKEEKLVENLLMNISKNGLAVYGKKETKNAVFLGAVDILLVTDTLIKKTREEKNFLGLEEVMKTVERAQGQVHIISGDNEAGKKLNSLGSIAAILRFKVEY